MPPAMQAGRHQVSRRFARARQTVKISVTAAQHLVTHGLGSRCYERWTRSGTAMLRRRRSAGEMRVGSGVRQPLDRMDNRVRKKIAGRSQRGNGGLERRVGQILANGARVGGVQRVGVLGIVMAGCIVAVVTMCPRAVPVLMPMTSRGMPTAVAVIV